MTRLPMATAAYQKETRLCLDDDCGVSTAVQPGGSEAGRTYPRDISSKIEAARSCGTAAAGASFLAQE